jgi:hypothetical protein
MTESSSTAQEPKAPRSIKELYELTVSQLSELRSENEALAARLAELESAPRSGATKADNRPKAEVTLEDVVFEPNGFSNGERPRFFADLGQRGNASVYLPEGGPEATKSLKSVVITTVKPEGKALRVNRTTKSASAKTQSFALNKSSDAKGIDVWVNLKTKGLEGAVPDHLWVVGAVAEIDA